MDRQAYSNRLNQLYMTQNRLLTIKNEKNLETNGIYHRYKNSILTVDHIPIEWCYDLDPRDNPFLIERLAVNAVFNAGAVKFQDKYCIAARVEGADRKVP